MADTHELGILFKETLPKLVIGSTAEKLYNKKNQFVYSVFVQRVKGGDNVY